MLFFDINSIIVLLNIVIKDKSTGDKVHIAQPDPCKYLKSNRRQENMQL